MQSPFWHVMDDCCLKASSASMPHDSHEHA